MTHHLTELHRHLDASFRPSTLIELVKELGLDTPYRTADDIRRSFWITRPMGSLKEVLDGFGLFQKVLRTPEIMRRVASEAVEDAAAEGIGILELRYSPTFAGELARCTWQEALDAFDSGTREAAARLGVTAGLICILSRGYGEELLDQTMDFAIAHKDRFIGVDLAGPEEGYPCRNYERLFRRAQDAGIPITIHAGEGSGPENVWEAIDLLGATRIGHGIRSIEDPELMRRLARDKILLETCPTSNTITRTVADWGSHPLPRLLEAGIPVSVSTDDPGIFGVTLPEEYDRCRKRLGLTDADLDLITRYARDHSFLAPPKKGLGGRSAKP